MYLYLDYYINTIGDKQNEMDFYGYCNEFVHNHDLVLIIVIIVVIIIRMNFTKFQFFKILP